MSEMPGDLQYTKEHEWLRREEDGSVTIGITDHAQSALGDLVYVELPELGQDLDLGGEMAVVESVKAASDVYAPISGNVLAINDGLADDPEKINSHHFTRPGPISVCGSRHPGQARLFPKCLDCGYDLRASREKCPECGRPVDAVS